MTEDQSPVYAKQVIVVRKDLKMKAGKLAAQVSHASMAPITNRLRAQENIDYGAANVITNMTISFDHGEPHDIAFLDWLKGSFTKVVVEIESEQDLLDLLAAAEKVGIPCVKIEDEGRTAFHGVRTLTCASFGPCYSDVLDELTGHLKLYNVKG